MRQKSSATSVRAPRPSRLRHACNQCHAAKVKCSGEKDGCWRCLQQSLSCDYSESMAGKVPGKRARRPAVAAAAAATLPACGISFAQPEATESGPLRGARSPMTTQIFSAVLEDPNETWNQADPPGLTASGQDDVGWSPGLSFDLNYGCDVPGDPPIMASPRNDLHPPHSHPPNHSDVSQTWSRSESRPAQESYNGPATQQQTSPTTPSTTSWAQDTPNPAFTPSLTFSGSTINDSQSRDSPSDVHNEAPESQGQPRTTAPPPAPSHADEAQCIQVCGEVVESLQGYLVADLKVIDIILPTVSQTLTTLQSLFDPPRRPGVSCSLHYQSLLVTCILQLVELISMGCRGLREEYTAALTRVAQTPAKLGIGLSMSAAERRDRKAAKVLEQLRGIRVKIADVLIKARLTSRAAPLQPASIVASFDRSVYELRDGIKSSRQDDSIA